MIGKVSELAESSYLIDSIDDDLLPDGEVAPYHEHQDDMPEPVTIEDTPLFVPLCVKVLHWSVFRTEGSHGNHADRLCDRPANSATGLTGPWKRCRMATHQAC